MKLPRSLRTNHLNNDGFSIIEIMIVLVIVGLVLLLVFMAVPALQRRERNVKRDRDAQLLISAITECLLNNSQKASRCDQPEELPITADDLEIYTGFHYGRLGNTMPPIRVPPTTEEPNWLFNLVCRTDHKWFNETEGKGYVVTYYREEPKGGYHSRCIEG